MSCRKFQLINTGATNVYITFRRCEDGAYERNYECIPYRIYNLWTLDGEVTSAELHQFTLEDEGEFPPIPPTTTTTTAAVTATPTPTITETPTPTITPTITVTPTITETPTPTPTNVRASFSTYTGTNSNDACSSVAGVTLYGDDSTFENNTQFYDNASGPVTTDMSGFYSNGTLVVELQSNGAETGGFNLCSVLPTQTPTPTVTITPTPTETPTPTPTPTFGFYTYSLGYDVSISSTACSNFGTSPIDVYAPVSGGTGPNIGETIYSDSGLSTPSSDGYYSNSVAWWHVTGGLGLITGNNPAGCP
jgi:hypothetical protein